MYTIRHMVLAYFDNVCTSICDENSESIRTYCLYPLARNGILGKPSSCLLKMKGGSAFNSKSRSPIHLKPETVRATQQDIAGTKT